jgi:hypothetical protein
MGKPHKVTSDRAGGNKEESHAHAVWLDRCVRLEKEKKKVYAHLRDS